MATSTLLLYIVGLILSWVIFYYVVKAAIRNGIKEARADKGVTYSGDRKLDKPANTQQMKLQQQYDKGEITFEVYQSEWDKLT